MTNIITPSDEQLKIIELLNKHNIIVDCSAGSGKTSSIIFIAEQNPRQNILVLTYNSFLKSETRKRTEHLSNIDIHSYHSFCTTNYDKNAYTDYVINDIVINDTISMNSINYDIIIADESQDMTPLLYRLISKIISDNAKSAKIIIMGDRMQSIYKFREADHRFITLSKPLFEKFNQLPWVNATLSQTFRCTIPMVKFINKCMIGYDRMVSNKPSTFKPDYVICNSFSYPRKVIQDYLRIYKPHDIFVISNSLSSDRSPIKKLANYITNNLDVPIYCSSSDQEVLDSRIIEGKLVFTTIHQSKGRERKVVLFLGFDNGYFEYFDKDSDPNICPNELYVVATRASERITLIHDQTKGYLPFLNKNLLKQCVNFIDDSKGAKIAAKYNNPPEVNYNVSELVSYLPFSVENLCINLLTIIDEKEPGIKLEISNIVKMENSYETVSDITGIAIPAYFEYLLNGSTTIMSKNLIEENIKLIQIGKWSEDTKLIAIAKLEKFSKILKQFHKEHIECINTKNITSSDILKISLYYSAQQNKIDYRLKQINVFDWLPQSTVDEGTRRLSNIIKNKDDVIFEESVERTFDGINIIGQIDCIDKTNGISYEFKCTSCLSINQYIQVSLYMYLTYNTLRFKIVNILTDERKEITSINENLEKIVKILVHHKLTSKSSKTDSEFLLQFS